MTCHFLSTAPEATAIPTILVDATRCWRIAHDSGEAVKPCLSRMLHAHDCVLLAPVLDSLIRLYEAALGRPMTVGGAMSVSDDEHRLISLMEGTRSAHCLSCSNGMRAAFDCALCATRVMLALTLGPPGISRP